MKISLVFCLFLCACFGNVKISDNLAKAWSVVNQPKDIYENYTRISNELAEVNNKLQTVNDEEARSLLSIRENLQTKLEHELEKVIQIQSTVEKASDREINYLAHN